MGRILILRFVSVINFKGCHPLPQVDTSMPMGFPGIGLPPYMLPQQHFPPMDFMMGGPGFPGGTSGSFEGGESMPVPYGR